VISATRDPAAPRRVLLALEPAGINPGSLQIAVQLSRTLRAELTSLLLEDVALLRAAALPFAREISHSGTERMLDPATLERSLRVRADRLREELARQIDPSGIAWSLRSLRGPGLETLLNEIRQSDVTVFGRAQRTPWRTQPPDRHGVVLYRQPSALQNAAIAMQSLDRDGRLPGLAWEAMRWDGTEQSLPLLRRRQPTLVLLAGTAGDWSAAELRQLTEHLDCPILLIPPF